MSSPARPRDAATVVLLRDGPGGAEAYVLRRVRGMPFAGGMTAFPGGSVDLRDADADVRWAGPSPEEWAQVLGADVPLARALVCAAVRETFEEAGILLAGPTPDTVVDGTHPLWEADRAAVERRDLPFADLLDRRGLVLRSDLLRAWAHWITPEAEPRRYDTRFFVAALPAGQRALEVTGEADEVTWLRPADALAEVDQGSRAALPPTLVTLREIAGYRTVADVLAAAAGRRITPITPEVERHADGARVRLPDGDAMELPPGFIR